MSRVFRRPMFRGGSTNMNGIMSGIKDRENYAEGTYSERYKKIFDQYSKPAVDPLSKLLIQGGLRGLSETRGGGTLANMALAFEKPTEQLMSDLQQRKNAERDMALAGLGMDIEDERARAARIQKVKDMQDQQLGKEKIAQMKIDADIELEQRKSNRLKSNFQKDFTPDRKYYELMKDRTNSAAELQSFQKPNIEQKYPRGTAQFDAYYSTDLLQSDNPVAKEIKSSFGRFVPYDSKKGTLNYSEMIPGMYYYDPKRNVYITNVPPSDEDAEGGFYVVNPTTYEKRKLNP
jgi:hypothetical protein